MFVHSLIAYAYVMCMYFAIKWRISKKNKEKKNTIHVIPATRDSYSIVYAGCLANAKFSSQVKSPEPDDPAIQWIVRCHSMIRVFGITYGVRALSFAIKRMGRFL